jgi:hypothetical protein
MKGGTMPEIQRLREKGAFCVRLSQLCINAELAATITVLAAESYDTAARMEAARGAGDYALTPTRWPSLKVVHARPPLLAA